MIVTILPPQKVTRKMRIRNISKRGGVKSTREAPKSNAPSKRVTASYNFGQK